ncbi:cyclin-like protein [Ceratobasidium sp. AG-I]|nr:cyclin-like protein [Ceratobasidium sp. AG-I]
MSSLQQWYFSPIDLLKTPSALHACSMEEELSARQKGVELLLRVAGQLRLPVNAFVAAACYFHRFYMRNSIRDYNYRVNLTDIAATCIFLATKVEECGRKLKDVATTVIFKTNSNLKPDTDLQALENSKEHKKWTENILVYEETLLDSLCFDLVVECPHSCLATVFNSVDLGTGKYDIFRILEISITGDQNLDDTQPLDSIVVNAWGIAHDTLRIPVCLFFNAKIIAASCFLISLVSCSELSSTQDWTDFPSPFDRYLSNDPSMLRWLESFTLTSSDIQQISDCIFIMLCFYKAAEPNERVPSPIPFQQLAPPTLASVQWPPTSTPQSSQTINEQVDDTLISET